MSHDSQSPIISLDLFITNPCKPAVQSTTTPKGTTTKPLETPRYTPCLRSPLFPLKTILEASGCQLLHCQPPRERKHRSGASGASAGCCASPCRLLTKAESRAHIATVHSADWTRGCAQPHSWVG